MDGVKVVCGLIFNEQRQIFICQRKIEKSLGGFWEFPGGKIESNESEEECLKRELIEELGMQVNNLRFFHSYIYDYKTFKINLISYLCETVSQEYNLKDHEQYVWTDPYKLLDFDLAPADVEIAMRLAKQSKNNSLK